MACNTPWDKATAAGDAAPAKLPRSATARAAPTAVATAAATEAATAAEVAVTETADEARATIPGPSWERLPRWL